MCKVAMTLPTLQGCHEVSLDEVSKTTSRELGPLLARPDDYIQEVLNRPMGPKKRTLETMLLHHLL